MEKAPDAFRTISEVADDLDVPTFLRRAAHVGNAVAQSRLAFMYATGRGIRKDPVQAAKWHIVAKAGGSNDQYLEEFVRTIKPEELAAAQKSAKPWLDAIAAAAKQP